MAPVRIASAQYPVERLPSLGAYRDKLARWVAEAAEEGAHLLVFPEYGAMEWSGAYGESVAGDLAGSLAAVAAAMPEMDAAHAELARHHEVHILAASGPADRGAGRTMNAARLFAPSGAMGVQDKHIMTPFERSWGITGGEAVRVFETALGTIAIAICYDSEFPLLVRAQVEAGARLLLVPSCTEFMSGYHRVRTGAMARALEGTCFSVVAPLIGDAPWSPAVDRNVGAAGIYAPADKAFSETGILAEGSCNRPQWVYATVEPAALEDIAARGEMRNRADWAAQPGAADLAAAVERIALA